MEPYPKKLGTDTWFYAKRTFLALAETLAKHMIMLKDAVHAVDLCSRRSHEGTRDRRQLLFLLSPAHHRRAPPIHRCRTSSTARSTPMKARASIEARLIKKMYIRLQHA